MSCIIVDTSVLVDIFLSTSPRHSYARKLANYLIENRIPIRIPMHALFEISCALKNQKINSISAMLQMSREINENNPLSVEPIPIDQNFIVKYLNTELPYMKAGDLIFVAMAKTDNGILITEDNVQYEKAKSGGVKSYRIKEFLDEFVC